MKRKIIVCVLAAAILLLIVAPVLANGNDEHPPSDVEKAVSAIGLILVTLSVASLFIGRGDAESLAETRDETRNEAPENNSKAP